MLFDELENENVDELFDELSDRPEAEDGEILSARSTAFLLGHTDIESKILHMIDTGRFPHGLIFSGPTGIGKSVMAYRLARFLFSEKDREPDMFGAPEPVTNLFVKDGHPVFSKVASGAHPDLLTIGRPVDDNTGRQKASVPVEEIRKIAPFMRKTASVEGGWRIVIVDDADTMTRSSQNSLLKILEEPPEKSLLILITHRAGALLPTVYSRCVHIPFQSLADDILKEQLASHVSPIDLPMVVALAEGSLGRAFDYALPDHLDLITKTVSFLKDWPNPDWVHIQGFAETFGTKGNDDAQRVFRETMMWVATSLVRGKTGAISHLDHIAAAMPVEGKITLYDRLNEHFTRCQQGNLDKRFLILGAFMAFEG